MGTNRKIFIDVGGYEGQTLDEVIKPRWNFDTIYCLEPMPRQFQVLTEKYSNLENVELFEYGLSDKTGPAIIYGDNSIMEASIYSTKRDVDASFETVCQFVEASEFLNRIPLSLNKKIIMKLNCEGAEYNILQNLIDTGSIWRLFNVMIDFDVRKIKEMQWSEGHILSELNRIGFTNYSLCDVVMHGKTHQDRIANWLKDVV